MDRATLLKLWSDAWAGDIWVAPWAKAVEGLSAAQAGWRPAPERHSIAQNVAHVIFWRSHTLDRLAGHPKPAAAEVEAHQFGEPGALTEKAWERLRKDLADSHEKIRLAIADPAAGLERLNHHLAHDSYHLGQIMLVRALQGLPPVV